MQTIKQIVNSTRFWAIVIGALITYAKSTGLIGENEMILIDTILGGYVVVKTSQNFQQ